MFRAVRLRLIGYTVLVLALVLLTVGAVVYVLLSRQFDAAVDNQLRAAVARTGLEIRPPGSVAVQGEESGDVFSVRFLAQDAMPRAPRAAGQSTTTGDWREMSRAGPVPAGLPSAEALEAAGPGHDDLRTVTLDGQDYRLLTRVSGVDDRAVSAIQTGVSLAARDRQERIVLLALTGGGALGLALTVVGGLFLTGRALVPVRAAFDQQRRFVADASHELRTPLALLRLEAEDLAHRLNAPAEARPLARQVDRLGRLIDNLLSLARMDEGAQPLEREPVHVESLLRSAAAQAKPLAAAGVRVDNDAPSDLWVAGDPDRLHQLLLILVDNAARATPPYGTIRLTAARSGGTTTLTVTDTGTGIPAEHLPHVFDRFYRADKARSRASGGTGLGLSIAREIVRAHGGEITLNSQEGKGTEVSVRLQAASLPMPPAPSPEGENGTGDTGDDPTGLAGRASSRHQ